MGIRQVLFENAEGRDLTRIAEYETVGGYASFRRALQMEPARVIEELLESSNGGFGAYLLFDHDWADPAAKLRSYELFAQYVMPHFQGQLEPIAASCDWVTGSGGEFVGRAAHAIAKAIEDHATERGTEAASPI